jgi:hypothetical protein
MFEFDLNGWCVVRGALSPEEVAAAGDGTRFLVHNASPPRVGLCGGGQRAPPCTLVALSHAVGPVGAHAYSPCATDAVTSTCNGCCDIHPHRSLMHLSYCRALHIILWRTRGRRGVMLCVQANAAVDAHREEMLERTHPGLRNTKSGTPLAGDGTWPTAGVWALSGLLQPTISAATPVASASLAIETWSRMRCETKEPVF